MLPLYFSFVKSFFHFVPPLLAVLGTAACFTSTFPFFLRGYPLFLKSFGPAQVHRAAFIIFPPAFSPFCFLFFSPSFLLLSGVVPPFSGPLFGTQPPAWDTDWATAEVPTPCPAFLGSFLPTRCGGTPFMTLFVLLQHHSRPLTTMLPVKNIFYSPVAEVPSLSPPRRTLSSTMRFFSGSSPLLGGKTKKRGDRTRIPPVVATFAFSSRGQFFPSRSPFPPLPSFPHHRSQASTCGATPHVFFPRALFFYRTLFFLS